MLGPGGDIAIQDHAAGGSNGRMRLVVELAISPRSRHQCGVRIAMADMGLVGDLPCFLPGLEIMVTPLVLLEGTSLGITVGSFLETIDRGIGSYQGGIHHDAFTLDQLLAP